MNEYPKSEAPYTEAGYVDSGPVDLHLEQTTRDGKEGIRCWWTKTPFGKATPADADGTRPATMVVFGKEYGTVAAPHQVSTAEAQATVVECPTQGVYCIPSPSGQPGDWPRDKCFTGIFDTPIAYNNGMMTVPYAPVWEIFIPFNEFMLAANACAIQTDGLKKQYYLEMISVGGNTLKTKLVFDYTSPDRPNDFKPCGAVATEPSPAPIAPAVPAEPAKGGGKPDHAGGPKKNP